MFKKPLGGPPSLRTGRVKSMSNYTQHAVGSQIKIPKAKGISPAFTFFPGKIDTLTLCRQLRQFVI